MKIYKFGGASVKDAEAVRNIAKIIASEPNEELIIVVSAMGKTTNALEVLLRAFYLKEGNVEQVFNEIKEYHYKILENLFPAKNHPVFQEIHNTFVELEWQIEDEPVGTYDFEYDQMVSIGEMLSTKIISAYLNDQKIKNHWLDVRDVLRTDNSYRKAKVDWELSSTLIKEKVQSLLQKNQGRIILTQGFVGATSENFTSTLGREGSDFSAAIFASALAAEEVVIWKDVDGMLNADPKYFQNTVKLNNISYLEAVELAYYGASVIHPKTIKPLQNSNIPLQLKSFVHPQNKGTLINNNTASDSLIPSYIQKDSQVLVSISTKDFAFVAEDNLSSIYNTFHEHGVAINCMQNSAISFSICIDEEQPKVDDLIKGLQTNYKVYFNKNVQLITIRHYSEEIIAELLKNKTILLEQKTRNTARFVVK